MTAENTSRFGTAFTESIEAREGVTTGISAYDRAHTIKVAIDPKSTAADLAAAGTCLSSARAHAAECWCAQGRLRPPWIWRGMAGLIPAGVICEIMKDDGTMARVPDLIEFCKEHGLKMLTVAELIRHRLQNERYMRRVGESMLPTAYGDFRMIAYESEIDGGEIAYRAGPWRCQQLARAGVGAGPLALPGGRCFRHDAMRLPRSCRCFVEGDRGGRPRCADLSAQREQGFRG